MKITSFSPLIVTTDPENTIKLFEELGFEKRHTKDDLEGRDDVVGVRMKDANGFYVDIVESGKTKQDMISSINWYEKKGKLKCTRKSIW